MALPRSSPPRTSPPRTPSFLVAIHLGSQTQSYQGLLFPLQLSPDLS